MDLKQRFYNLVGENNLTLWKEIETKYSASYRKYHNLNHLEEIFSYYDNFRDTIVSSKEFEFAVFYHDIVYNIFKGDNELKSAELAVKRLVNFEVSTTKIYDLILATKTHEGKTNDEKILIDFDLAILGSNPETYNSYAKNIRKEYRLIPNFIYNKGRIKVLKHFLEKKTIFKTPEFINIYENQARENLKQELQFLIN